MQCDHLQATVKALFPAAKFAPQCTSLEIYIIASAPVRPTGELRLEDRAFTVDMQRHSGKDSGASRVVLPSCRPRTPTRCFSTCNTAYVYLRTSVDTTHDQQCSHHQATRDTGGGAFPLPSWVMRRSGQCLVQRHDAVCHRCRRWTRWFVKVTASKQARTRRRS
jgi:hypothetical protein